MFLTWNFERSIAVEMSLDAARACDIFVDDKM